MLRWPGRQLIAYAYIFLPVCGSFIHKLNSDSMEVTVFPAESMEAVMPFEDTGVKGVDDA